MIIIIDKAKAWLGSIAPLSFSIAKTIFIIYNRFFLLFIVVVVVRKQEVRKQQYINTNK